MSQMRKKKQQFLAKVQTPKKKSQQQQQQQIPNRRGPSTRCKLHPVPMYPLASFSSLFPLLPSPFPLPLAFGSSRHDLGNTREMLKVVIEGQILAFALLISSPSCQFEESSKLCLHWLVVSTHLKNIGQNGNLAQIGVKIKNI